MSHEATSMSSTQNILLIYTGMYMLILVGIWIWQLGCKDRVPLWLIAALLTLWPITLFLVVTRIRHQFRREAENTKFRRKQEAFRETIEQGIRSAEMSAEISADEKNALNASLNAFKSGSYEAFPNQTLQEEVLRFWQAGESASEYVSQWLGDLVSPWGAPTAHPGWQFARSSSSNAETSHGEWLVALTKEFMKSIAQIDRKLQGRILEALGDIAHDPVTVKGDTMKPLSHEFAGLWRYRLGDFRLIYQPLPTKRHVLLLALAPRGAAYG